MNTMMVDAVSQPRRLAEIRRRRMHDNNELHRARVTIQELMDEKYQESRFVSEKSKAEDDLKCVTTNLAEERVIWARDVAKKDHILSHAKDVQEELERKAASEAQKASNAKAQAKQVELEEREEQLRKLQQVCDSLVSEKNQLVQSSTAQQACLKEAESALDQSNAEVDSLTRRLAGLQGDRNWLITNGVVWAFEYLRQSEFFVTLLDRLSTTAYKSGHHDGVHEGYVSCQQTDRITPEFQVRRGKLTAEMADALEAVYNDPLPAYAELVDNVAEDGVDSLRQMLDVVGNLERNECYLFDISIVS
ncbi:hypothetical protein Hanom_Chr11g00992921 [Helianthus anomalus]